MPMTGGVATRGRTVHARSVNATQRGRMNASKRRVFRTGGSVKSLKHTRGTQVRAQWQSLQQDIRTLEPEEANMHTAVTMGVEDGSLEEGLAVDNALLLDQGRCQDDTFAVANISMIGCKAEKLAPLLEDCPGVMLDCCMQSASICHYEPSPWDLAVARSARCADEYMSAIGNIELTSKRLAQSDEKVADSGGFEQLRNAFLRKYDCELRSSLGYLLQDVVLTPTPLAPEVQQIFVKSCSLTEKDKDGLPCNLRPAIHGTNADLFHSIFSRGLLIPGQFNGLRVMHGSVHGLGIYTTSPEHAVTSKSYCSAPRMLVCGVLDSEGPAIAHHSWGRVIFDSSLVAPLFVASSDSWGGQSRPPVATPAASAARIRAVDGSLETIWWLPRRPRAPKAAVTPPDGARAFLMRRAAQRRRT